MLDVSRVIITLHRGSLVYMTYYQNARMNVVFQAALVRSLRISLSSTILIEFDKNVLMKLLKEVSDTLIPSRRLRQLEEGVDLMAELQRTYRALCWAPDAD